MRATLLNANAIGLVFRGFARRARTIPSGAGGASRDRAFAWGSTLRRESARVIAQNGLVRTRAYIGAALVPAMML